MGILIERLEEFSLAGGSAKFSRGLEAARVESEIALAQPDAPVEQVLDGAAATQEGDEYLDLALISGEAAVMKSYSELEQQIISLRTTLASTSSQIVGATYKTMSPAKFVNLIRIRGLVDRSFTDLFDRVRNLRNLAAHGRNSAPISVGEAIEFRAICQSLQERLREVASKLH